ncbi:hypothetical protein BC827DRAFT_1152538 [Russula dissimulans]|nr:hypothetical protein BC827DRAFT_1152538 [Russula dissimulans]
MATERNQKRAGSKQSNTSRDRVRVIQTQRLETSAVPTPRLSPPRPHALNGFQDWRNSPCNRAFSPEDRPLAPIHLLNDDAENIFYGQKPTRTFDRPQSDPGTQVNGWKANNLLSRSSTLQITSLLLGVDKERKYIYCGLVDSIIGYTIVKTLGYKVKGLSGKEGKALWLYSATSTSSALCLRWKGISWYVQNARHTGSQLDHMVKSAFIKFRFLCLDCLLKKLVLGWIFR